MKMFAIALIFDALALKISIHIWSPILFSYSSTSFILVFQQCLTRKFNFDNNRVNYFVVVSCLRICQQCFFLVFCLPSKFFRGTLPWLSELLSFLACMLCSINYADHELITKCNVSPHGASETVYINLVMWWFSFLYKISYRPATSNYLDLLKLDTLGFYVCDVLM